MAEQQDSNNNSEKEKERLRKEEERRKRREEHLENSSDDKLDNMIAYVDENGNLTDTPPDPTKKQEVKAENIVIGVPRKDSVYESPVRTGRVKFFNDSKGFGFIKDTETQEEFFVHVTGLKTDVQEGDLVTFELEKGMKGLNAVNVKK